MITFYSITKSKQFMNYISNLTEQEIQSRIDEIYSELNDIKQLKANNRLSSEDIEDVSDNYQYNLEWNYAIGEYNFELKELIAASNKFHKMATEE